MALGILIKTQRRIWFEVLPRVRTSQPDWTPNGSFREFLAWENSRHLACVTWRFWSGAQTSQGGRGQWNCEVFYFPRCFAARSRAVAASPLSGAPDKTAMPHRLPTFGDVTNGFPTAQVTGNRSQVKVREVSLLALITVQNRVLAQGETAYLSDLSINQWLALVTCVL